MCGGHTDPDAFPRSQGRKVTRGWTDKACSILFATLVGLGAYFAISGWIKGADLKRLTHGVDWEGKICGVDPLVKDKKFMMFCGSNERSGGFPKYIDQGSTVCVSSCPANASTKLECLMPAFHNFTSYKGGSVGANANVETLDLVLTQSVVEQMSYPTEEYGGRFCLPSQENPELREMIIDGPWGQYYRPLVSFGGLIDAWPLIAIAAGIAVLFGCIYLNLMMQAAGPLILGSMIISTLFTLALGIFFFLAVVMDMDDASSNYCSFNPISSVYIGDQAKLMSIVIGILFIVLGVLFGAITGVSLRHIDESIGLIDAACEPFRMPGSWALWLWPTFAAVSFLALASVFAMGGMYLALLGKLDYSEISVNGIGVQGMQRVWKKSVLDYFKLYFYMILMLWLLEFYLQLCHYVVAYTISCWYFTPVAESEANAHEELEAALGKGKGKKVDIRVAGVDENYGNRTGTIMGEEGEKMLVVPVSKKGPGVNRHDVLRVEIKKSDPPSFTNVLAGFGTGMTHHVGSIFLGSLLIFIFRPFRMVSEFVSAFLDRITEDEQKGKSYSADPHTAAVKSCLSLVTSCLQQVFGKYSKNSFTHLLLSGGGDKGKEGFLEASDAFFERMSACGGSVYHLHGAMLLYEIFGGISITLFAGWTILILQQKLDMFNEKSSPYYIEDKVSSAVACIVVTFCMSFAYMSVWNQTADVLLYCVSWNRLQHSEGEEHNVDEGSMIQPCVKYCPQALRHILPKHELEVHAEKGLVARGIGKQGALLAAMENTAMAGAGTRNAPNYNKSVAAAHETVSKPVR